MSALKGGRSAVRRTIKTLTLTGGAALGVAGTAVPLFVVTGDVLVHLISGKCTTSLTEGASTAVISLGTVNQVTRFIGTMNSVDLDINEWWVDTTPVIGSADPANLTTAPSVTTILASENIVLNPTTQDTDGGVIRFVVLWEPVSSGATLVRA